MFIKLTILPILCLALIGYPALIFAEAKSSNEEIKGAGINNPVTTIANEKEGLSGPLPLPVNQHLESYFLKELFTKFKDLMTPPIVIDKELTGSMYHELRESEKMEFNRIFRINAKDPEKLKKVLQILNNKRLRFDSRTVIIEKMTPEGNWTVDAELKKRFSNNYTRARRGRLVVIAAHEMGRKLELKGEFSNDKLIFFPLNAQSLRYLGNFESEGLCDKTYREYFQSFVKSQKNTKNPLILDVWKSITNGYNPESFSSLPREQQKLIHDTVGIYLAEEFRVTIRRGRERLLQLLPGSLLIATYLHYGGEPPEGLKMKNNPTVPRDVESDKILLFLPHSYATYSQALPAYDRIISEYVRENNPELFKKIQTLLADQPKGRVMGIITPLLYFIESSKEKKDSDSYTQVWNCIEELINIIKSDAHLMNKSPQE
jgi:hypothetical protein